MGCVLVSINCFNLFSSHEHIEILTVNGELLFFRQREGPFYPTLRLLHKCESLYVDGIVLLLLI